MASDRSNGSLPHRDDGERLQKVLAAAGVASRRVVEEMIVSGRITVNGTRVTELGSRVDPAVDQLEVDGIAVQLDTSRRYVMLNKPLGIVSSLSDERGRRDLTEFTEQFEERLFNVGRLDAETTGLLLLTNDGELGNQLAHPSFGVAKTYVAKVAGKVTPAALQRLLDGVELDDGLIEADAARVLSSPPGRQTATLVEITLHSGRNRIVRRMLDAVGHPVLELHRREFGPLRLGTLGLGEMRDLTAAELGALLTLSRTGKPPRAPRPPRPPKGSKAAKQAADPDRKDQGARRGNRDAQRQRRDGDAPNRGPQRAGGPRSDGGRQRDGGQFRGGPRRGDGGPQRGGAGGRGRGGR